MADGKGCSEDGCDGAHHGRGLCVRHYRQLQRGSLHRPQPAPGTVPDLSDVPTGKLEKAWAAGMTFPASMSEAEVQSRSRMMLAIWLELACRGFGPELPEPKQAPELFVLIAGVMGAALFGKSDPHVSAEQLERLAAIID